MPTMRSQEMMQDEALHALRARFEAMGLFSKWKRGARCAVLWALGRVPEELWARGVVCPAERAVMLGATSKRVRALLARLERRVPAAVHVVGVASMEAVIGGLVGLQGWCQVVRLDLKRGGVHQSGRKGQGGWRGCWGSARHSPC